MEAKQTVLAYIDTINAHDVEKSTQLMAEEHRFIDAYAAEVQGRQTMRDGWLGYFQWFPDYRIEVTELLAEGDSVAVFGYASGTYHGQHSDDKRNYWRLPAAWRAVAPNERITLWQVFCDSKIPLDIMDEADGKQLPEVNPLLKGH